MMLTVTGHSSGLMEGVILVDGASPDKTIMHFEVRHLRDGAVELHIHNTTSRLGRRDYTREIFETLSPDSCDAIVKLLTEARNGGAATGRLMERKGVA